MTKEIIIDGVDVAGCCYYNQKNDKGEWCDLTCERESATGFRCETMPNCYYKQLKRLEQENGRLKEELKIKENISEDFRKNALEWAEIANNYFKENSRLYKTLQEIKKECHWTSECGVTNDNMWGYERILDLITKAEEE